MEYKYSLFWPYTSEAIRNAVVETLKTRWIGQGAKVDEFEAEIGKQFNRAYPIATNSGSAALELAYELARLQPGDHVISPVLTCTATNIPLLRRGVELEFADIDMETLCIDPEDALSRVKQNTKAIIGVNLGGIQHEVEHPYLPIITDAAQGIGQTNGDYVMYSFQAIKHFSTGDGGLLFTPDEKTYKRGKLLRWFGIDREKKRSENWSAYKERQMTFDIYEPGFKYHMNDIAATMGIEGLKVYFDLLAKREFYFTMYKEQLKGVHGIKLLDSPNNVYWLATCLVEARDEFAKALADKGIETNMVHLRNDIYKVFGGRRKDLPNMDIIESKYIYIPLHQNLTSGDVQFIINTIKKGW